MQRNALFDDKLVAVLFLLLASTGFVGCEPPPVAEKKPDPKPVAQAKASQPQFAPRATPKPTPTAKPTATVVVVAPPPPPPPPKRLEFEEVALAGNRKVTRDMIRPNRGRIVQMFPTTNTTYYLDADPKDDLLRGVFGFSSDGKLEGGAISYQADHVSPRFIAQFHATLRDGNFWGYSTAGELEYWAEFRKGQHEGLTVLVKKQAPVLVQEWRGNVLKAQYLVELVDNKQFVAREMKPSDAAVDKSMQELSAELKRIEERYLEEEKAHRRHFVEYYRVRSDFDEYVRLTRTVAASSPGKREELRKHQEFVDRERRLFERWQLGFWKTPL
ncbi:MAG: hypothetical protein C0483_19060 [Pirellula sp.]|nr:hypothetical protein [Pirellula sp.]